MIELYNLFVSGNLCFYLLHFDFGLEKHSRKGPQFIDLDKAKRERAWKSPHARKVRNSWYGARLNAEGHLHRQALGTSAEPRRGQVPATKSLGHFWGQD